MVMGAFVMLPLDKNSKNEIKAYFQSIELSSYQKKNIENLLKRSDHKQVFFHKLRFFRQKIIFTTLVSIAAIFIAFLFIEKKLFESSEIHEVVLQPADFEGRFSLFQESQGFRIKKNHESSFYLNHKLRKIQSTTGKIKSIYTWRQENYADAMVQR
jgi:hypothetical protein